MQKPTPTDLMKQRDEELDKKIEALRRKNEALMKRYQEVEEDKKKAEQEGMALQSRKSEDLSITINKTTSQEPRVVTKRPGSGGSTPQDKSPRGGGGGGGEAADGGPNHFGMGRGKRRQLFVTMVGNNKGTRVVSESAEPPPQRPAGRKSSAEEEEEERSEPSRRGKHAQPRKRSSQTQEDGGRQEGKAAGEDGYWLSECDPYYQDAVWPEPQPQADLTIPTSREEQQEYLRWKAEREQIDRERVARHKNAKGQWRRAWDLDKPQLVFSDKPPGESERQHSTRAGRGSRRGHSKSAGEPQGPQGRGRERKGKNAPAVVGSKAKGKDRLTGRARRWDAKDKDEDKQASETSLEEFLEELDALCDPDNPDNPSTESEVSQNSDGTAPGAADSGNETVTISHEANQTNDAASAGASPTGDIDAEGQESVQNAPSPKGPEKKVRFSSELVQDTRIQKNPRAVTAENKGSLLKAASAQVKTDAGAGAEPKDTTEQQPPPPPQQQQQQQQQEDAGREHQEEQDTHDVRPTGTEDCGSTASPQHAQEDKAEGKTEDVKVTDDEQKETELEKEKAKQPEEEAQMPPLSTASETTEAVERASTTIETETGAPTQPDQCPDSQQAATIQATNTLAQNTQTTNTQSPAQQAPNTESLNTQSVDTQAPNTESPTTQATTTEATSTQKPAHQGPEHTKTSTSRATEELIDSSLSVLSLDTGDTHPDHVTSTEKAREDGKVV